MFPAACAGCTLSRPSSSLSNQQLHCEQHRRTQGLRQSLQSAATVWVGESSDSGRRGARLEGRPASRIL